MKIKLLYAIAFLFAIQNFAQSSSCAKVIDDTFEDGTTLSNGWTEYNTTDRVTVEGGKLKFNHNTTMPSAYRTFTPTSTNSSFSFDVSASRNTVNCQIDLISSTGKYISSIVVGKVTSSIKYATTLEDEKPGGFTQGEPKENFLKNTVYTLTTKIDFNNKIVSFYNNNQLMTINNNTNISFLEDAENVAKIDIRLIYMYANNGQFYFDNISLSNGDENRLLLETKTNTSQTLLNSASVGNQYNQYSQADIDTFQIAINNANTVLANCDTSSTTIDTAITDLETAQETFTATRVNNPVLKLYSGSNFSGQEHEVYCGYYNGGLGEYEDWAVSFKLEKGYMATFAQDINGLGVSKIYIAQDNAVEINLPIDLQNSISFIRVSPWFPVQKKGSLGDVKWTTPDNYNTTWHYNWGLSSADQISGVQFVPMAWSKSDNWTSIENMEAIGKNMSVNHLMAFNEPDNSGQSNLTVAQALEAYPKLLASGLRLGAPGVENIQYSSTNDSFNDGAWIQEFMDSCVARGYRVDFIPAHDYVRRSKSTFIERFKALHDRYNLPVWVTEYNYGNPNMGSANLTVEQGYNNIKGLTEVLEEADFIERYNWYYFFGASSGIGGITDGELNITGQFYRDFKSKSPSYIQEIYQQGELSFDDVNKHKISFYPNPITNAILSIDYADSQISKNTIIKIVNTAGQEFIKITGTPHQIDVSSLENGIYLVQVTSSTISVTQKIMITK